MKLVKSVSVLRLLRAAGRNEKESELKNRIWRMKLGK